jgi:hypothetical protein
MFHARFYSPAEDAFPVRWMPGSGRSLDGRPGLVIFGNMSPLSPDLPCYGTALRVSVRDYELIPSSFGLVVEGEDGLDDGGQTVG